MYWDALIGVVVSGVWPSGAQLPLHTIRVANVSIPWCIRFRGTCNKCQEASGCTMELSDSKGGGVMGMYEWHDDHHIGMHDGARRSARNLCLANTLMSIQMRSMQP